ncbi:MAG: hypothetical protein ACTIMC_05790 [Kluyvera intermedia]
MDRELREYALIERVEMIARLTAERACQERDREIALIWIAEVVKEDLLTKGIFLTTTHPDP